MAELVSEERRDDGRRCLVGSQTVGVCGAHDACLEQSVVTVDSHERLHDEHQEAQVVLWRLSRSVEQYARVGGEAPVVVLSRAVDARIRLLVEQHPEAVPARNLLHERHEQHVMVYRKVALLVYRSKLKLVRSHLVVAGLARNAKLKSLHFEVFHESLDTFRNGSEVVVVHLLVLCGVVTHERASGKQQVGTCGIKTFVHEEILLFPSQIA